MKNRRWYWCTTYTLGDRQRIGMLHNVLNTHYMLSDPITNALPGVVQEVQL